MALTGEFTAQNSSTNLSPLLSRVLSGSAVQLQQRRPGHAAGFGRLDALASAEVLPASTITQVEEERSST